MDGKSNVSNSTAIFYSYYSGYFWFLKSLFACLSIIYISRLLRKNDLFSFVVSYVLMRFFLYITSTYPIIQFPFIEKMFFCLWFGFFYKKYYSIVMKYRMIVVLLGFSLYTILFFLKFYYSFSNLYFDLLLGISASISIIELVYYLYKLVKKNLTIHTLLSYWQNFGRYTMGIYLVQGFFLETVMSGFFKIPFNENTIAYTSISFFISIVVFLFCSYFIMLTSKSKMLNLLLYGKQY